jgi:organic radical activating enzyme
MSITKINPNVHNMKNTMCFRTWNDLIISLPRRRVEWCCKTLVTRQEEVSTTFDLETLERWGLDFFINHPVLKRRKHELSGGTRCHHCQVCWKEEDTSGKSARTDYMDHYDADWIKKIDKALEHPKSTVDIHRELQNLDRFRFIEIELTNKCNMACMYCWEGASTRWQKETGNRMPDTDDAMFDKVIELLNDYWDGDLGEQEFVEFSLLGGEPFFTDHMFKFLNNFIVNLNDTKRADQRIRVTVTTNLNFPDKKLKEFFDIVDRTPNIQYMTQLSGEAVGKRSEIIRHGLIWNTWDKNLTAFMEGAKTRDNVIIGFGCAHNSLSYPYFKEFLVYLNDKIQDLNYEKSIYMHANWVNHPQHLSVSMIDPTHTKEAEEILRYWNEEFTANVYQKERYTDVLSTLVDMVKGEVPDEEKFKAYWAFNKISERRKHNYVEFFPHFNELIDCEDIYGYN